MTSPRLVESGPSLRTWACPALSPWTGSLDGPPVDAGAGRGPVARMRLGAFAAIVRTYRRGGLLARVLPDAFAGPARALAEVEALERLAARGLAPRPLVLEASGHGLVRLRIAVEEVEGGSSLLELARAGRSFDVPLARRVGDLVLAMHEAGVSHPDLHVGNVLASGPAAAARVQVIDLDGATLFDGPVPPPRRERAVLRLCRSLDKWTATAGTSAAARAAFLRAALPPEARLRILRRARRLAALRRLLGRRPA